MQKHDHDEDAVASGPEMVLPARVAGHGLRTLGESVFGAATQIKSILLVMIGYMALVEALMWDSFKGPVMLRNLLAFFPDYLIPYLVYKVMPFLMLAAAFGLGWAAYQGLRDKVRKQSVVRRFMDLSQPYRQAESWFMLALYAAVYAPFMAYFVVVKSSIPVFAPFAWDAAFADVDQVLHGGLDPWRLTWAVFGADWATVLIDRIYTTWFAVIYLAPLATLVFDTNRARRNRLILSHVLIWIVLGSAGATALSSAGPIYYDSIAGLGPRFVPLIDNLHAVNAHTELVALRLQNMLYDGYIAGNGLIEGISAMPSVHVAQVVLLGCAAHGYGRKVAVAAWLYAAAIFIGSVHLGWHYAVDGYAAGLGALAIWHLSRFVVRRHSLHR